MPPDSSASGFSKPRTSSPCQQLIEMGMRSSRTSAASVSTPASAYASRALAYARSMDCLLMMSPPRLRARMCGTPGVCLEYPATAHGVVAESRGCTSGAPGCTASRRAAVSARALGAGASVALDVLMAEMLEVGGSTDGTLWSAETAEMPSSWALPSGDLDAAGAAPPGGPRDLDYAAPYVDDEL